MGDVREEAEKAWRQLKRIQELMCKVEYVKKCNCEFLFKTRQMLCCYMIRCQYCGGKLSMEELIYKKREKEISDSNSEIH